MAEAKHATKLKRTAKDSVFCDLFSQEEYLLELYRALHPEDEDVSGEDLEIVTMERILTDGMYNDLGFTAAGRLLVLVEAQSTWSDNISTRMLMYLAETYRVLASRGEGSLHDRAAVRLPAPELYVVYTGEGRAPAEASFARDVVGAPDSSVDVRVRVLRGGTDDVVGQYVSYTRVFNEVASGPGDPGWKAREVVRRCVERGILVKYVEERRKEVEDIMFTLFDQERETELYHKRLRKQLAEEITREITQEVTDQVTREVTDQVTREVTDQARRDNLSLAARMVRSGVLAMDAAAENFGFPESDIRAAMSL